MNKRQKDKDRVNPPTMKFMILMRVASLTNRCRTSFKTICLILIFAFIKLLKKLTYNIIFFILIHLLMFLLL